MGRAFNKLQAINLDRIKKPKRYSDGLGLWFQVTKSGGRSWLFQFTSPVTETVRQMGPGAYPAVGLAKARERAAKARDLLNEGNDPIEAKRTRRQEHQTELAKRITFQEAADRYIRSHRASWKSEKHADQWTSTIRGYCYSVFGELHVAAIDTALILSVLEPIWTSKAETAARLRGRIERILDWAKARGMRSGDNPARWRGHLHAILPSTRKVKKVKHHPALPYADIPPFMTDLRKRDGIAARALEFTTLTASRTNEAINAIWPEFDFVKKVWTIPAERMKGKREHRVPLSDCVLDILKSLPHETGSQFVFLGGRKGKPLSNMAMLKLMQELRPGFVPHGLRSTFRDWAAEETAYPNHVVEMALAHAIENKSQFAYRRGELLMKRARLMGDWAKNCARHPAAKIDNVVSLRRKGKKS